MGAIRIIVNEIELDFVKESLTIKKENNAFITNLKVSHSSYPFMIIENDKAFRALGTRDLASVQRRKTVPAVVIEMGHRYYGEIEVLEYMRGYRKCNLRFGSDILQILNSKLSDLLPVVSIIPGETDPEPFSETALATVPGYELWPTYPLQYIGKVYPEVNFGFPKMWWRNKFGEETESGDEWHSYSHSYNEYYLPQVNGQPALRFMPNDYDLLNAIPYNRNIPSPQLFLLGILRLAFQNIGYRIEGSFTEDAFIRRLQVLSLKGNLCKVIVSGAPEVLNFPGAVFTPAPNIPLQINYDFYVKPVVIENAGTYTFKYRVVEPLRPGGANENPVTRLVMGAGNLRANCYDNYNSGNLTFEGEVSITVPPELVGGNMGFIYYRQQTYGGVPVEFEVQIIDNGIPFQMQHPTIPLGRYAPDQTLATYINELKNTFCLSVDFDDVAKVAYFNFTKDILLSANKSILLKSLVIENDEPPEKVAVILRYDNDTDTSLYITRAGVELNKKDTNEFTETIESRFKIVPLDNGTANLAGIEDKTGVGLLIYDETATVPEELNYSGFQVPIISADYLGQVLNMDSPSGIYNKYWKSVINFKLNASSIELSGPFTETEIAQIDQLKQIYTDNQAYVVLSMEYSETRQGNYLVKFKLKSINF